jgi:hypothetical protein
MSRRCRFVPRLYEPKWNGFRCLAFRERDLFADVLEVEQAPPL